MSKEYILLLTMFLYSFQQKSNRTCSLSMQPPLDVINSKISLILPSYNVIFIIPLVVVFQFMMT